ncbi:Na(+)-translocating NADH-quinone reductase subunit B [Bacteroidia bacterium]|nr:Na(+)-translocating NADH-quinone reductase subunit B [Bacteroidia bacterium]
MSVLRNHIDKLKPNFEKGGRLHFLRSTAEAAASFLYVPNTVTDKGTHIRDAIDLKRIMSVVIVALMPALLFGMWNVGFQHYLLIGQTADFWTVFLFGAKNVLPIIVVSYVTGLGIEFVVAQWRGHEVNEGFLVTGLLIPMIMPVTIPLWMVALATAFAVIIGKEVFGGTGMNIFNPALLARAFIFFAYPSYISGDKVWVALSSQQDKVIDGFSGATSLAQASNGAAFSEYQLSDMLMGFVPGSIGETSTIAILIGGLLLLFTGVASIRIMLSVFAGGLLTGLLFNVVGGTPYLEMPAYYHLIMGGFAFGAVFMATDPVTSSQTNKGKWIYGFLIGMLAVLIRVFNPAYPEGMMLAILLMNAFAPLIDYYVVQANINRRLKRMNNE